MIIFANSLQQTGNVVGRKPTYAVRTTKWNWNKTASKLFSNCFVSAKTKRQNSCETF